MVLTLQIAPCTRAQCTELYLVLPRVCFRLTNDFIKKLTLTLAMHLYKCACLAVLEPVWIDFFFSDFSVIRSFCKPIKKTGGQEGGLEWRSLQRGRRQYTAAWRAGVTRLGVSM